ncbi:MAG: phosphoribosyltransferase family protein [Patescibacteria group bacterium]
MGGLARLFGVFWDALFPRACVVCEREGDIICVSCAQNVKIPAWHLHTEREGVRVFSRASYKERAVQRLLHAWKYKGDSSAGEWWQKWISETAAAPAVFHDAIFVPVPLAREAFAERGFNQAELLARALAAKHGGSVKLLLERLPRKAQAKTEKEDRGNARTQNPYHVNLVGRRMQAAGQLPKEVILVDDVYTTGSTIMACADMLKEMGVEKIFAITLAYGNDA